MQDYDALAQFASKFASDLVARLKASDLSDLVSADNLTSPAHLHAFAANTQIESMKHQILVEKWREGERLSSNPHSPTFAANHQSSIFYVKRIEHTPSAQVKAGMITGVVLGLCALPLFFFEPISASMLALAAILLILHAYRLDKKELNEKLANLFNHPDVAAMTM